MSYHILLNHWSGTDQDDAASKLAKLFRMDDEEAVGIVEGLANGNAWQFQHQVSAQQSEIAENFLRSLGFEVERMEALEDFSSLDEEEVTAGAPAKGGFFGKVVAALTKKR